MPKLVPRLNLLAVFLLGGLLASVLAGQVRPGDKENEWEWPKTLEVCPSHPGDPVKLVRIMKGGEEVVPGRYRLPEISGDDLTHSLDDWLADASFVVENHSSKNIVFVGLSVILPAQQTNADCHFVIGGARARDPFCDANPGWCGGGCPALIRKTVNWGRIPAETASGLKARYRAEGRYVSPYLGVGEPLEGKGWLRLAPDQEVTLSLAGRGDSCVTESDPRHGFSDSMNGIVYEEGIDEANGTTPCAERANSKTGCAFAEVSKFNIGVDVVYFEDGTIWGNYGYGYALPNPDGVFTRVDVHDFPRIVRPASPPN